jgi:hypothetical protein
VFQRESLPIEAAQMMIFSPGLSSICCYSFFIELPSNPVYNKNVEEPNGTRVSI